MPLYLQVHQLVQPFLKLERPFCEFASSHSKFFQKCRLVDSGLARSCDWTTNSGEGFEFFRMLLFDN